MEEIIIRYAELPPTINGITVVDSNGDYNVYINAALSSDAQQDAYDHENRHIKDNHFYNGKPVSDCETIAKGKKILKSCLRTL